MFVAIAAILTGIWLFVHSQGPVSTTLTAVFGVAIAILGLVELFLGSRPYWNRPA